MTRTATLNRILTGLDRDAADYRRLEELLVAQFDAAMRHRADETEAIVERILALTVVLEARRAERVALAGELLAGRASQVSLQAVSVRLSAAPRAAFDDRCARVEALVQECKRLNTRNCHLITSQQDVMRRVLNTEQHTYAPA